MFQDINKIIVTATLVGAMPFSETKSNKSSNTSSNSNEETNKYSKNTEKQKTQKGSKPSNEESSTKRCDGCGSNRHNVDACTLKSHPDFNKNHATTPWETTEQYATIQKNSNGKFSWLGERYRVDGTVRPDIPSKKEKKG